MSRDGRKSYTSSHKYDDNDHAIVHSISANTYGGRIDASKGQFVRNVCGRRQPHREPTKRIPSTLATIPHGFQETCLSEAECLRVLIADDHPPNKVNAINECVKTNTQELY